MTAFTATSAVPELLRRGVYPQNFSVEGVHDGTGREGTYLLHHDGERWLITLRDRSDRRVIASYDDEGLAADAFVELVSRGNRIR